jgi:hypothetical protein
MQFTPSKLNTFLMFKLPAAYICGVRVKEISTGTSIVTVRHKWINQNPFKSMYFAVQAMAAELSTGIIVMLHINNCGKKVSMLVTGNKCTFTKKARGRITFKCTDGLMVKEMLDLAIATGEGQTFTLRSTGIDEQGDKVSEMDFEWSIKVK